MTTTHAAAQAELTHAGREVSQEETDRWLKGPYIVPLHYSNNFNPRAPINDLAARLLCVSNGLHSHPVDGTPASEPGVTKHARFAFHWGR